MFTTSFVAYVLIRAFLIIPMIYCITKQGQKLNNLEIACMITCVLIGLIGISASKIGMVLGFMKML